MLFFLQQRNKYSKFLCFFFFFILVLTCYPDVACCDSTSDDDAWHFAKSFQQETIERIDNLMAQNIILQNRIIKLEKQLENIELNIIQIQKAQKSTRRGLTENFIDKIVLYAKKPQDNLLFAGSFWIVITLTALTLLFFKLSKSLREKNDTPPRAREDIAAKLDLARIYVAMNDKVNAEIILRKIIKKGSQAQQNDAYDLLNRIKN